VFDELVGSLRRGDTLVVWKFDRAARSMQGLINLACDLDRRGIRFVSLVEKLDTADPMIGKLSIAIFGWLAEMESHNIGTRVAAGIKAAKARGTYKNLPGMRGATKKRKLTDREMTALCVRILAGEIKQVDAAKKIGVHKATISRYLRFYLRTCAEDSIPTAYKPLARKERRDLEMMLRHDPTAALAVRPGIARHAAT
jgi:DNA invertase Pin-like site-specific DNA recombinase